ncbi:hypothetical protein D9V32_05535 [Mycetocola tolaasinivorans]|uniref:Uncharacterized protein n=1 Tax=Mycetocola tolaasinivorans TaxID=76635 RepID=A0A3L7AAH6_9MICO|nr:hypothetical protein [Mycetocola tolaasinivorans]RLP76332.1 hypothetical protein D9V32_05535 [Mycetocola tolaasinivorans]
MPDIIELAPPAVDQTGNTTLYTAKPADVNDPLKPKVTEAKKWDRCTYNFTPDGYNRTGSQEILKDERLSLQQALESPGKSEMSLEIKYVDSIDPKSLKVRLKEGDEIYFVEREGIPNATEELAGQLVTLVHGRVGKEFKGPRDGTGVFTYTRKIAILSPVGDAVPLVTGA